MKAERIQEQVARLPWRGAREDRPALPVPPEPMPLLLGRRFRKRWRWVGAFADNLIVFAAIVQVGPAAMTFWGIWDRERRRLWERTRRDIPGRRRDVVMRGSSVRVRAGSIEFDLELDEGNPIECMCPNGEGGYSWTRKAAGMPVRGEVRIGRRTNPLDGLAVTDDSAGYHQRYTSWKWSAGVGTARDGRRIAWNLVRGINDPPTSSERAIWVVGDPVEPGPISFQGLESIHFEDESRLNFSAETERTHHEGIPLLARSEYEAPFGTFTGSLNGLPIESALGVMEAHDAIW
ncbi:MAG TPA: DUF2804 family protein [Solirubrobacterales bacterium]|nr:DUF2804 family protein [Solirubrobacterales bacterium]